MACLRRLSAIARRYRADGRCRCGDPGDHRHDDPSRRPDRSGGLVLFGRRAGLDDDRAASPDGRNGRGGHAARRVGPLCRPPASQASLSDAGGQQSDRQTIVARATRGDCRGRAAAQSDHCRRSRLWRLDRRRGRAHCRSRARTHLPGGRSVEGRGRRGSGGLDRHAARSGGARQCRPFDAVGQPVVSQYGDCGPPGPVRQCRRHPQPGHRRVESARDHLRSGFQNGIRRASLGHAVSVGRTAAALDVTGLSNRGAQQRHSDRRRGRISVGANRSHDPWCSDRPILRAWTG